MVRREREREGVADVVEKPSRSISRKRRKGIPFLYIYVSMKIAIVSWDDNFSANWINGDCAGTLSAMMAEWCCWIVFSFQRITFYVRSLSTPNRCFCFPSLSDSPSSSSHSTLIIQSAAPWRITRHWMKKHSSLSCGRQDEIRGRVRWKMFSERFVAFQDDSDFVIYLPFTLTNG